MNNLISFSQVMFTTLKGGDNMIEETTAERLNKIKAAIGISGDSKSSLALKLGMSRNSLARKLKGDSSFTVSDLEKLALIYGYDRKHFF